MAKPKNFKVIIVGGSVIGLTLANALERAGIDFVLLEKRQIAPDLGASISLLCHSSRVYEQLGVVDHFNAATMPLLDRHNFSQDGCQFEDGGVLKGISVTNQVCGVSLSPCLVTISAKTQRPFRFLERRFYLQTLYNNLQDQSKVHTQASVKSFVETDCGVTVFTDDEQRYEGSILVGADGVHSIVRQLMSQAATATDPARAKNLMSPFTASYRAIFATSQNINPDTQRPYMPDGTMHVVYHQGVSGLAATGVEGLVFWFLFVKEDKTTRAPDCPRYSEEDAEATINQFGHLNLGSDYTFRDLWNCKIKAAMFPMEEGVIKGSWNNGGRVVLLGDSASKATINAGLGGNTHVEGVCHLVNEMMELLQHSPEPCTDEITEMFNKYEEKQRPRAELTVTLSSFTTRYEAMETWWMRSLMPVMRWLPVGLMSTLLAKYFAAGPLIKFPPRSDA
ncbi:FAD/NAD(P)-binding domain-containing protein [Xylaria telfairii]|nr:FAD/NAD(P)-binding domain-containing protein [Xylaria telfairii]